MNTEIYFRFFVWFIIYFLVFLLFGFYFPINIHLNVTFEDTLNQTTFTFEHKEYEYSYLFLLVFILSITITASVHDLISTLKHFTEPKPMLNIENDNEEPTEKTPLIEKPESNIELHYA